MNGPVMVFPEGYEHPSVRMKREVGEVRFEAARLRYRKDAEEALVNGSQSDFLCGFEFVLNTYNEIMWRRYFAEEKAA